MLFNRLISLIKDSYLSLDKDLLRSTLTEILGPDSDISVDDFMPLVCDQTDITHEGVPERGCFTKLVATYHKLAIAAAELMEGTPRYSSDNTSLLAPLYLPIAAQLASSSGQAAKIKDFVVFRGFGTAEGPEINPLFHVDFQALYRGGEAVSFSHIMTVLPSDVGPTTRYIDFPGKIEIPHYKSLDKRDLSKVPLITDKYCQKLIKKHNLAIGYFPANTWIKVPYLFVHASPLRHTFPPMDRVVLITTVKRPS